MGAPCVTIRHETEWTETIEAGANHLLFPEEAPAMLGRVVASLSENRAWYREAYGDGNAAIAITAAVAHAFQSPRVSAEFSAIA
jgi:UDP-GlcNAc3NAcA epimerase